MQAHRGRVDGEHVAVDGIHDPVDREADRAARDQIRIVEESACLAARHEAAVREVAAIEERLAHERQAGLLGGAAAGTAETEERQLATETIGKSPHGGGDDAGGRSVGGDGVVERAMRLHVADVPARRGERLELVVECGAQFDRRQRQG